MCTIIYPSPPNNPPPPFLSLWPWYLPSPLYGPRDLPHLPTLLNISHGIPPNLQKNTIISLTHPLPNLHMFLESPNPQHMGPGFSIPPLYMYIRISHPNYPPAHEFWSLNPIPIHGPRIYYPLHMALESSHSTLLQMGYWISSPSTWALEYHHPPPPPYTLALEFLYPPLSMGYGISLPLHMDHEILRPNP